MTRTQLAPPATNLLHVVGDIHFGGIVQARIDKVTRDLAHPMVPRPELHLCIGDMADTPTTAEETSARAWLATLPAAYRVVCGNHDIWDNVRTSQQVATMYGNATADYTVDLSFARLIVLSYDVLRAGDNGTQWLSDTQLLWLEARLAETSRPCLIACHNPLYQTVSGDTAANYTSYTAGFYVRNGVVGDNDTNVRAVLARHSNAKAWISGHTHSPYDITDLVKAETVGTHTMAMINATAIPYVGKTYQQDDPIYTLWLNVYTDRIEVRYRDHGAGIWYGPAGARVTTITL